MDDRPIILVADDEPSNVFLFEGILEQEGYRVISASDGEEALEKVASQSPALVITDLLMPRVHGFNLVMEMQNNEASRSIPIIITTAVYRGPLNQMEAQKLGASGFLEKPVDQEKLVEMVKALVPPGSVPPSREHMNQLEEL